MFTILEMGLPLSASVVLEELLLESESSSLEHEVFIFEEVLLPFVPLEPPSLPLQAQIHFICLTLLLNLPSVNSTLPSLVFRFGWVLLATVLVLGLVVLIPVVLLFCI